MVGMPGKLRPASRMGVSSRASRSSASIIEPRSWYNVGNAFSTVAHGAISHTN
jgi:hypothetical protein